MFQRIVPIEEIILVRKNLAVFFEDVVKQQPNHTALFANGSEVASFLQLNERANSIARVFLNLGVTTGATVALLHQRSVDSYASMIACLKLGCPYVNIDPNLPQERMRSILDTACPVLVLTTNDQISNGPQVLTWHDLDLACTKILDRSNLDVSSHLDKETEAYLMFTSGSTGKPKGAIMRQENLFYLISWAKDFFDVVPADRITQLNPPFFDNSVFDFYCSLFNGASLIIIPSNLNSQPRNLIKYVGDSRATIWFSVPSLLVYILNTRSIGVGDFKSLRHIVFGGEGFPKTILKKYWDLFSEKVSFTNVYGPTECTCISTAYRAVSSDFLDLKGLLPLGHMIPGSAFELGPQVDNVGELLICGAILGSGYKNDVNLTEKAFIHLENGRRAYRTGDLVQLDVATGLIYFRGRVDNQVKVNGFRVELEDVEAQLSQIDGIIECAVVLKIRDEYPSYLVGYIACDSSVSTSKIYDEMKKRVPKYMVPREIKLLTVLPKNANGKIDRLALKEMK